VTTRARRLLALALLVGLIAAAWLAVVQPLLGWRAAAEARLAEAQSTLGRYRAVEGRSEEIARQAADLRQVAKRESLFLPGATAGQAAAALQDAIKAALAAADARADSIQALETSAEGGLVRIAMRVRLSADTKSLQKLLHGLEAGRPVVMLEGVYVRARSFRADGQERNLDVRFDAVGFAQTGRSG
jgi:general secretion pathway protein M